MSDAPRLMVKYTEEIAPKLMEDLGLSNRMEVPTIEKIVLNMGIGEALDDKKAVGEAIDELGLISGQKPRVNRARKSIANFEGGDADRCSRSERIILRQVPLGGDPDVTSGDSARRPSTVTATTASERPSS